MTKIENKDLLLLYIYYNKQNINTIIMTHTDTIFDTLTDDTQKIFLECLQDMKKFNDLHNISITISFDKMDFEEEVFLEYYGSDFENASDYDKDDLDIMKFENDFEEEKTITLTKKQTLNIINSAALIENENTTDQRIFIDEIKMTKILIDEYTEFSNILHNNVDLVRCYSYANIYVEYNGKEVFAKEISDIKYDI